MSKRRYIFISILVVALLGVMVISTNTTKNNPHVTDTLLVKNVAVPNEQCYSRMETATQEKPFSVEEYMHLKFDGEKVEGVKFGFQQGPGYSNGYTGTLSGIQNTTEVVLEYSYIVEGSRNTEQEIYHITSEGIERMQYKLLEKNNTLIPDRSAFVGRILYIPLSCAEVFQRMPI